MGIYLDLETRNFVPTPTTKEQARKHVKALGYALDDLIISPVGIAHPARYAEFQIRVNPDLGEYVERAIEKELLRIETKGLFTRCPADTKEIEQYIRATRGFFEDILCGDIWSAEFNGNTIPWALYLAFKPECYEEVEPDRLLYKLKKDLEEERDRVNTIAAVFGFDTGKGIARLNYYGSDVRKRKSRK